MMIAFVVCDQTSEWGEEGQCALVIGTDEREIRDMIPGTWTVDVMTDCDDSGIQHLKRRFG